MAELTEERVRELVREELGQALKSPAATTPIAAPAMPPVSSFKLSCNGAVTTHSRGLTCDACQAGYPLSLREPPMIVVGFENPVPVAQAEIGKHVEPQPAKPILERDPMYPEDEHAGRCPGRLHAVLKEDTIQYHSFLEVCEDPGCSHTFVRKFPHSVT